MDTKRIQDDLTNVKSVEDLKKLHWGYSIAAAILLILIMSIPVLNGLSWLFAIVCGVAAIYLGVQAYNKKPTPLKWWLAAIMCVALAVMLFYIWVSVVLTIALIGWGLWGAYQGYQNKQAS